MNRKQERKIAFEIIFSFPFNKDKDINDLISVYFEGNEIEKPSEYILQTVKGTYSKLDEIDTRIKENIRNRKFERLDNVCLAAMRLAVYEMIYNDDIPVNVAINEAIELTKQYDDSLSSFVHGNLSIISKLKNE